MALIHRSLVAGALAAVALCPGMAEGQSQAAQVAAVNCLGSHGEVDPMTDWQEVRMEMVGLEVVFNKGMYDPTGSTEIGDVENKHAYRLLSAGAVNSLETESCDYPWGDEEEIEISSVEYDPVRLSARVNFAIGAPGDTEEGQYRLLICDDMIDDQDRLRLDGDHDGTPGGGVVISYRIERRNKFVNGYFDTGVEGWTPVVGIPEDWSADPADADDALSSHSAALANLTALPAVAVGQCVGFESWERVYFRSKVLPQGSPDLEGAILHECTFFDNGDCTGATIDQAIGLFNVDGWSEDWLQLENAVVVPQGTRSAACFFSVIPDDDPFEVLVDEIELVPIPSFRDDFEGGHLGRWGTFFPIPE